MRFSTVATLATTIALTAAAPVKRQETNLDPAILQFALTLEHLENAFYKKALSEWSLEQFTAAGFDAAFYDRLKYIAHDEEGHVIYLQAGLTAAGAEPVKPCQYAFPMTDPKGFVALAATVEGLGVSAYLGAAADITSKAYLTAAGSILVTEALHQSTTRAADGRQPSANVFGTPLGPNAVFSIASAFITSCPETNYKLPFMAYENTLTLNSGAPTAFGASISLTPKTAPTGAFFVTFVSGLEIISVEATRDAAGGIMAAVPEKAEGQSYVFLTNDNSGNMTDANIIAGPAIVEITPMSPTFNLQI